MKNTLLSLLLLLTLTISFTVSNGQCTPDVQYTTTGYYPNPIPAGCVNVAYNQVETFVFPADTVIFTQTVPFDSFKVDSLSNVPPGLTYACNVATCVYATLPQPQITRGCALISGTPTVASADSVTIYAKAYFKLPIVGTVIAAPISIKIPFTINAQPCTSSGLEHMAAKIRLAVYPNPLGTTSMVTFNLEGSSDIRVSMFDMFGKEVRVIASGIQNSGFHQYIVNTGNEFPAGVYYVKFSIADKGYTQTISVVKF